MAIESINRYVLVVVIIIVNYLLCAGCYDHISDVLYSSISTKPCKIRSMMREWRMQR